VPCDEGYQEVAVEEEAVVEAVVEAVEEEEEDRQSHLTLTFPSNPPNRPKM